MMLMHGSLKIMTRQDSLHNFILSLLPCRGLRKMVFTDEPPSKIATCRTAQAEQGPVLKYVKLTENASAPTRGSPLAAGFDLKSAYDYTVMPHSRELIKTDLQISMPAGCYARIAPRSGLAVKHFIDVGAGVVDADYTGNICVVLFNFGKDEFKVNKGDRIAQLILEKIIMADLEECSSIGETERGSGGFGSTGTC